jgi:hypothetical protein
VVRKWTPVVLAAALLARLPAETLDVSLQGPGGRYVSGVVDIYVSAGPAH